MLTDSDAIEAVIFDMDGVLFHSNHCHAQAFEQTLAGFDIANFSYPSIAGMRTDEAFRQIFAEANRDLPDHQLDELVATKRHHAQTALEKDGQVAANSHELIANLRPRYRLVLASSGSPGAVNLFLTKSRFADAFEFCLDGSTVKNAKPAPEIYHLALQRLGLDGAKCVVIEDSANGVRAAVAAGIQVVGLANAEEGMKLTEAGASVVVPDLKAVDSLMAAPIR